MVDNAFNPDDWEGGASKERQVRDEDMANGITISPTGPLGAGRVARSHGGTKSGRK